MNQQEQKMKTYSDVALVVPGTGYLCFDGDPWIVAEVFTDGRLSVTGVDLGESFHYTQNADEWSYRYGETRDSDRDFEFSIEAKLVAGKAEDGSEDRWKISERGLKSDGWNALLSANGFLRESIIAGLWFQENDGYEYRDTGEVVEVDVTDEVLALSAADIRGLEDDTDSTNDLVSAPDNGWTGPHRVVVVEAVCDYFGVEDLADVTQQMVDSARANGVIKLAQRCDIRKLVEEAIGWPASGPDDMTWDGWIARSSVSLKDAEEGPVKFLLAEIVEEHGSGISAGRRIAWIGYARSRGFEQMFERERTRANEERSRAERLEEWAGDTQQTLDRLRQALEVIAVGDAADAKVTAREALEATGIWVKQDADQKSGDTDAQHVTH